MCVCVGGGSFRPGAHEEDILSRMAWSTPTRFVWNPAPPSEPDLAAHGSFNLVLELTCYIFCLLTVCLELFFPV